jgi:glycosidase
MDFCAFTGIQSQIDHLMYLGIDAVLFSPFMDSPMVDMGRDISDFKSVNKIYGTMEQVEKLFEELRERSEF